MVSLCSVTPLCATDRAKSDVVAHQQHLGDSLLAKGAGISFLSFARRRRSFEGAAFDYFVGVPETKLNIRELWR
jgi:hypothetical protein